MDARTLEIPKERWSTYFAQVEALQRDHPVEVELISPELGDQPLTHNARLRGISVPKKGSAADAIELDLGMEGGLDHRVLHPAHVYAIQAPTGLLECLDIEDSSKTKTLIRFTEPKALPGGEEGPEGG